MKKLNKLFTLFLALVCVFMFSLVGCTEEEKAKFKMLDDLNGKTTQEIYADIMSDIVSVKNNFTTTVSYDIPCSVVVSMNGYSMNMSMDMQAVTTFKMAGNNFYEKAYLYTGPMTGSGMPENVPGEEYTTETWLVDGYAYLSDGATKYKYGATLEQLAQFLEKEVDELWNPIYNFSDTAFDDVKFFVNNNDSSDIYFELVLSGQDAANFAKETLESLSAFDQTNISFGDISYKFIITEEGKLENVEILYNVVVNVVEDGMNMVMNYTFDGDIKFTDIGTTTISAPADAADYYYLGDIKDIIS